MGGLLGICVLVTSTCSAEQWPKHDFNDPSAPHKEAAIRFETAGEKAKALQAFQSAARFSPSSSSLADLGVCNMRHGHLKEAEEHMIEAWHLAKSKVDRSHVDENLNVLEQHLAWKRGEQPHNNLQYRRRKSWSKPVRRQRPSRETENTESSSSHSTSDGPDVNLEHVGHALQESTKRPSLVHDKGHLYQGLPFNRVTRAQLDANSAQIRKLPFILVDGTEGWGAVDTWSSSWRDKLARLFPTAVVDFYPFNMLDVSRQSPYLTRLPKGIKELQLPKKKFHWKDPPADGVPPLRGRYMHLQLTPGMWKKLESLGDIRSDRHDFLKNDDWFDGCMSKELAKEWHLKTHWKIILTGTRGAGMFNHSDTLRTSSWHAHVIGKKWWYVCGSLANGSNQCFEEVLQPGEILYYPPDWHHETQCLDTPTMTITDTVAHRSNVQGILQRFHGECTGKEPLRFDVSAQLCDALNKCAEWWRDHLGEQWSSNSWRPWRRYALPATLSKLESTKPTDNNYDGRNFILER